MSFASNRLALNCHAQPISKPCGKDGTAAASLRAGRLRRASMGTGEVRGFPAAGGDRYRNGCDDG